MICFLQAPVYTIAANAGVEGAVVVGKLLEQDNPDLGYDAAKGLLSVPSTTHLFSLSKMIEIWIFYNYWYVSLFFTCPSR